MKANSAMPDDLHFVERKPVRIGVVGCGVVADYGHLPTIHSLAETELVGVADPDAERLSVQVEKYGVPGFESFEAMLGAVEMDAKTAIQPDLANCHHFGVCIELFQFI